MSGIARLLRMALDLVAERFTRLLVQSEHPTRNSFGHRMWSCQCDCGSLKIASTNELRRGLVKSCGCLRRELGRSRTAPGGPMDNRLHEGRNRPEYRVWRGLLTRTLNPKSKDFPRYGGRGIRVCERWRESFTNFFEDMGQRPSPSYSIDRIDNDGPYSPENCRWATRSEQSRNTSQVRLFTIRGETKTIADWAEHFGLTWDAMYSRVRRGWTEERF
jgi:hypothetical protein